MKFKNWILILILFLALALRVFRLDDTPISLFGDEIDVGLQAYSILTTGKDYFGNNFPLMFKSFEESRLPLFIYSAVPMVGIFGLNEWGVRSTGVFWGILGILGIYLLTKELFGQKIALFAALILAITPWHIQYSRQGGIEAGFLLTVLTFAGWSFIRGLKNYKWLVISVVLFGLSFYTYAISALFVALLGIGLFIFYFKHFKQLGLKKVLILGLIFGVTLLPFIYLTAGGKATERSGKISVFGEEQLNKDITERRALENHSLISKIFHNKVVTYSTKLGANYFNSLSGDFLFFRGDPNLRHSPDLGMLYFFQFILIVFGIISLVKVKKDIRFLLIWLFLAPIPSIITQDGGFHGSRLILLLLPLTIFCAIGLNFLLEMRKNRLISIILLLTLFFMVINISIYIHRYYNDYRRDSWRFWQTGYKEAMLYIKEIEDDYSKVYFNNTYEPSIPRFLFWNKYNMEKFQNEYKSEKVRINDEFIGATLDNKYHFGSLRDEDKYRGLDKLVKHGELYMVSTRDEAGLSDWRISAPGNIQILKTITNPFNQPIFYVVTRR